MILSTGDIVADKYRIERFIGEGGMGTVYAAVNQLTGRTVALKWLRTDLSTNETFAQRFMREARVSGRLDHPNIVNVYDVGRHRGTIFLVMELLRGEPFDAWLRRSKPSPAECIGRLMPALRAVAAAHSLGVVHRDLKPEHIYLCRGTDGTTRQTKVLDFGIAKELGASESTSSLTNPGSLIGTVHYMAPEQVRNSSRIDARSDIYSLGVILYYSLGGGLPYEAESMGELILKVAEARPERLAKRNPKLPKKLADIVMRAMSRDPGRRYQTVAGLARALEPFSGGVPFEEPHADDSLAPGPPDVEPPPGPQPTTTMASASALGKRVSVPTRLASPTTLALIVLPAAMFVLVLAGSWAFTSRDPVRTGASAASVLQPPATASPHTTTPAATSTTTDALPRNAPSTAVSMGNPVVLPGKRRAEAAVTTQPAHARAPKTAATVAVAPSTAEPSAPRPSSAVPLDIPSAHEPGQTPIENNPYLRH